MLVAKAADFVADNAVAVPVVEAEETAADETARPTPPPTRLAD